MGVLARHPSGDPRIAALQPAPTYGGGWRCVFDLSILCTSALPIHFPCNAPAKLTPKYGRRVFELLIQTDFSILITTRQSKIRALLDRLLMKLYEWRLAAKPD